MSQQGIVVSSKDRLENIRKKIAINEKGLAAIMPKGMEVQRFMRIVISACSRTPKLLACTPDSILMACAQAAALGLEPNTPLGHAHLVPFKDECTLIPSYKGLAHLAYQSGMVKSLQARAIHEKDLFEIDYGTDAKIIHKPCVKEDPGALIAVYAVCQFTGGGYVFDVMSIAEVNKIRDKSKAAKEGPWVDHYEEMAKKTVIRRLSKSIPMSEQKFARALELQANAEAGEMPDFSEMVDTMGEVVDAGTGEVAPPKNGATRTDKLKEELAGPVSKNAPREPGSDG